MAPRTARRILRLVVLAVAATLGFQNPVFANILKKNCTNTCPPTHAPCFGYFPTMWRIWPCGQPAGAMFAPPTTSTPSGSATKIPKAEAEPSNGTETKPQPSP